MHVGWKVAAGVSLLIIACSSDADGGASPVRCGAGTTLVAGECRPIGAGGDNGCAGSDCAGAGGDLGGVAGDPGVGGGSAGSAGNAGNAGEGGTGDVELVTSLLTCAGRDVSGATVLSGAITSDMTWSGVVHVPETITIRNEAEIIIEPGTTIIVGLGADLEFGWEGSHPTVTALGTVDEPIRICGETDTPGYWGELILNEGVSEDSLLRNVLIAEGGSDSAALVLEGPVTLQGVQIRDAGVDGVHAASFTATSELLRVTSSGRYPVVAKTIRGVELPADSRLINNEVEAVLLDFDSFGESATFRDYGVPYRQLGNLSVASIETPILTFEAGVTYELGAEAVLSLEYGALEALGAAEDRVVFSALPCAAVQDDFDCNFNGAQYALGGAIYVGFSSKGSRFEHTLVRALGFQAEFTPIPALTLDNAASVHVDSLTIQKAHPVALELWSGEFDATSAGLDVEAVPKGSDDATALIFNECEFLLTLPSDTVVDANGGVPAEVACSVNRTGTLQNLGFPYLADHLIVYEDGDLTIEAGTKITFSWGLTVESGGVLTAEGTADAPIELLGTNWQGVVAGLGSSVTLDHVVIDDGGASNGANLEALAPVALKSSTIRNSNGWGVLHHSDDTTDYATSNTYTNNALGDIGTLP